MIVIAKMCLFGLIYAVPNTRLAKHKESEPEPKYFTLSTTELTHMIEEENNVAALLKESIEILEIFAGKNKNPFTFLY